MNYQSKPVDIRKLTDSETKAINQLFIGKVIDEIGSKRTMELMLEAKKAILK